MNISQKKPQAPVTVKHAIDQLKSHKAGLIAHEESDGGADFYIDRLERSDSDFLLDAFEHSKGIAEKWSTPIGLYEDGTIFGIAAFPSIAALTVGIMAGPAALGIAALGATAYTVGLFTLGEKLHAHARFAEGSDFMSEAVAKPRDMNSAPAAEHTKQDLLEAYDKKISAQSLPYQTRTRKHRAVIESLPDGNVAELLVGQPEAKYEIQQGLQAIRHSHGESDAGASKADMPVAEALTILQERRDAQLRNLDHEAASVTGARADALKSAKGNTLLEAYEDLKQTSNFLGNASIGGAFASASAAVVGGVALAFRASVVAIPAIAAAGVIGAASYLLGAKDAPIRDFVHATHEIETALANPVEENENQVSELSREQIFNFVESKMLDGTLENQSYYRDARNRLEKRAGANGLEMFTNAVSSKNDEDIALLKSVFQNMQESERSK